MPVSVKNPLDFSGNYRDGTGHTSLNDAVFHIVVTHIRKKPLIGPDLKLSLKIRTELLNELNRKA